MFICNFVLVSGLHADLPAEEQRGRHGALVGPQPCQDAFLCCYLLCYCYRCLLLAACQRCCGSLLLGGELSQGVLTNEIGAPRWPAGKCAGLRVGKSHRNLEP